MALITEAAREELIALFVGMFNAAPGADNLSLMVGALEAGGSASAVAGALAARPEFNTVYPSFLTGQEFADRLVENLLGDEVGAAAKAWSTEWVKTNLNAGMSRGAIILTAIQAIHATANTNYTDAKASLENKVEVATYYSVEKELSNDDLSDLQDVIAGITSDDDTVEDAKDVIDGVADSETGKGFTLKVGEDSGTAFTGTSGNDVFDAPIVQDNNGGTVSSLENFDVLTGGDGVDTLNATIITAVGPVLKSVENVNVRFTAAVALDLANSTGVTDINVSDSSKAGTITGVGSVANLSVKSQTQNVTFTGNKATTLNLTLDTVTNTVTLDKGATTLNLTTTGSKTTIATLDSVETLTIAATGSNTIDLTASKGAIETATITGAGTVDISATTLDVLTTLTATANTGGVTAKVDDTAVKISTGAGKDSITYTAAIGSTAVVNLGDGNDTFVIAGKAAAGATVTGGGGTDTLTVTDGSWLDADAADVYASFETLAIGGGKGDYDMANLPGLTAVTANAAFTADVNIKNAAAGTTLTLSAKADVDFAKNVTYALETATGKSDAVTLTLASSDSATTLDGDADGEIILTKFTANDIETFTIASTVSNVDPLLANTDYTNKISALNGDAVTTINITGSANLVIGDNLVAPSLTKINASAFTGMLTVDVDDATSAAQSVEFLGGKAMDTYTGTKFGDTINAGKGGDAITLHATDANDTLIFVAGDSVLNEDMDGFDMIANFDVLDIIDLGAFDFTGQQSSALATKGLLAASVTDGTVLTQVDFFLSGGVDRGVAVGNDATNTFVFIDVNKDGNFDAANDLFIELAGLPAVTLSNFGF